MQQHPLRPPLLEFIPALNPGRDDSRHHQARADTGASPTPARPHEPAARDSTAPMSPPDKRGGAGAPKGPTHVFRGGSPRKELPASSSSSTSSAVRTSNVIAAPPRAQLSSSPSPEGPSRTPSGSGPPLNSSSSSNGAATPMSRRSSNAPSTRSLAVSALSSTEAVIKDKDARIAALERELELLETEFQRQLDQLSRNESETASFWQLKHSALNQQFLRTDTELRLLRDEMRAREAETEDLTRGWRDALRLELKGREDEIRGLQAQIRGLKEWVSTSTRADGTTSDEVFGSGMANLGNGLQNWVITYFRKVKIDLSKASETALQELADLVPMYDELAQTAKIHLLQSIVSRVLVNRIFRAYFVGLSPDQEHQLKETERMMASFGTWAHLSLPCTLPENRPRHSGLTCVQDLSSLSTNGAL